MGSPILVHCPIASASISIDSASISSVSIASASASKASEKVEKILKEFLL